MSSDDHQRFANLSFDDFRRRASDVTLSATEKVGFPDDYRDGKEQAILADVVAKLPVLAGRSCRVVDIGPGCSAFPQRLIEFCVQHEHDLTLVDSQEMLDALQPPAAAHCVAARFPDCAPFLEHYAGRFDAVLCYSVFHYVFYHDCAWRFVDAALNLLAPGGGLLLGDLPNHSKRKRFLASEAGRRFHREYSGRDEDPQVAFNLLEPGQMDDAVVVGLLQRARAAGYDAYILPQAPDLPMANRREDLLFVRP